MTNTPPTARSDSVLLIQFAKIQQVCIYIYSTTKTYGIV